MPLIEEKYDQARIDKLRRYLQRETDKGRPKDYEIVIDNFKVVSRTNDLNEFEEYEPEIGPTTCNVAILVFDGPNTNRNTRYSFNLNRELSKQEPMEGLGAIDKVVTQRLAERDRDYELERLREKLKDSQQQVCEAEQYQQSLEAEIEHLKADKSNRMISLGDLTSSLFMGLVRHNAHKIPGLAGFLDTEDKNGGGPAPTLPDPVHASYEKQHEQQTDEVTRQGMALIQQLQRRLNEQQMIGILSIIEHLSENPDQITTVIQLIQTEN